MNLSCEVLLRRTVPKSAGNFVRWGTFNIKVAFFRYYSPVLMSMSLVMVQSYRIQYSKQLFTNLFFIKNIFVSLFLWTVSLSDPLNIFLFPFFTPPTRCFEMPVAHWPIRMALRWLKRGLMLLPRLESFARKNKKIKKIFFLKKHLNLVFQNWLF